MKGVLYKQVVGAKKGSKSGQGMTFIYIYISILCFQAMLVHEHVDLRSILQSGKIEIRSLEQIGKKMYCFGRWRREE
jgi:hypothetical protein